MRLLLTIGMNPLPVLVAGYRLCCHFRNDAGFPAITAVCSSGSESEARKIKERLEGKLRTVGYRAKGDALAWDEVKVSPGNPDSILNGVLSRVQGAAEPVHLHYTGGTKAMVAHAMQVLGTRDRDQVSTSYLDINDHRLHCWNMSKFGGPVDERKEWKELTPSDLAELHGMTVVSRGSTTEPNVLEASTKLYDRIVYNESSWNQWQDWKERTWRASFTGWDWGKKDPPKKYWPIESVPWPAISSPGWDEVPEKINAAYTPATDPPVLFQSGTGQWAIHVQHMTRERLKGFVEFLESKALEHYVFERTRALSPPNQAVHSFRARSSGASKDCEIDVVATLGYHIVALSCTEATRRDMVKGKGFEVWHRARQIGGDGARAVVVSPALDSPRSNAQAEELENDLADDVGLQDSEGRKVLPVRFFGFGKMRGGCLGQALADYLEQDLNWR